MAGGIVIAPDNKIKTYNARLTWRVVLTCIIASTGGLLFGFDNGITGGVTSMPAFLHKFFPDVYHHVTSGGGDGSNAYCKYNNQGLQLFTSSLFLAGMIGGIIGGFTTRAFGRRRTMMIGGILFIIGAALQAGAVHLAMLIVGRIMLGFGVGLANQSVPLYLSEMAPPKMRGGLNNLFQLATTTGILVAQLVNYGTQRIDVWGWRLSVGLAAVPAIILTLGGALLPETPNSLIERGHHAKARKILQQVRGTEDVDMEIDDITAASAIAAQVKHPLKNIFLRRYRPELCMAVLIPFFQQFTGINSIVFYSTPLFVSLGLGQDAAFLSSIITGIVFVVSTVVAVLTVDKFGRRVLFIQGGVQMLLAEVVVAILLAVQFNAHSGQAINKGIGTGVIVLICLFIAGFGWSWGPLGWLLPSEIQPLETRSAGQGLTVAVNFLFTFLVGQTFLSMLCTLQFGIFLFFAAWVLIMTLFVIFLLPETRGIPIEEMVVVWRQHWLWSRYIEAEAPDAKAMEAGSKYAGFEKSGMQHDSPVTVSVPKK